MNDLPSYDKDGFLLCWSFSYCIEWLKENSFKHLLADCTYCISKYGKLKLIIFFMISNNERAIPLLFIITTEEKQNIITYCLNEFRRKTPILDQKLHSLKFFFISDMAMSFYNYVKIAFKENVLLIWCEFHVNEAIEKKLWSYLGKNKGHETITTFKRKILN